MEGLPSAGTTSHDVRPHPSSSDRNDAEVDYGDDESTTTTCTSSTMIRLPKGTIAYRYKVVTYIGILVAMFFIGSIIFAISTIMRNSRDDEATGSNETFNGKDINEMQKRDIYRYYSNLLATELSSEWEVHQELLRPTSSEYKALQWLLLRRDNITITTILDMMASNTTTTTASSSTSKQSLVQRFAITAIYIHFQLYQYMPPNTHECAWDGITCGNSNGENDTTTTDANIITGINITSLRMLPSSESDIDLNNSTSSSSSSDRKSDMFGPVLGTTIPESICYVSPLLTSIDLSKLDLVGTIPIPCYLSTMWDNMLDIRLEENQLQQFFTPPLRRSALASAPTMNHNQSVWWPKIRYINVAGNILKESIIDTTASTAADTNTGSNNDTVAVSTSTSILHWNQLQYMNVQGNSDLYGKLFETNCLSRYWPKIEEIEISETKISGTIPDQFNSLNEYSGDSSSSSSSSRSSNSNHTGVLSQLRTFAAYRVPLSGSVPNMFGTMATNLEVLALGLSDNVWTGTLPDSYGNLTALKQLSLSHLNGITGTLPASWGYGMTNLESLDMFGNPQLSGSIPSSWGEMTSMATLRLGQTNISGTIPSELGRLTRLVDASFHRTSLSGSMPTEICQLRKDQVLGKLSADCIADALASENSNDAQVAPVTCLKPDCCTACS